MPAHRVPNELKELRGNPGKRPLPTPEGHVPAADPAQPPALPDTLQPDGAGSKAWWMIWQHATVWVSPATDMGLVVRYCELLDDRERYRSTDWTQVEPDPSKRAKLILRAGSDLLKLESTLLAMEAKLGLTPADRSKIGKATVEAASTAQKMQKRASGPRKKEGVSADAPKVAEP